MAALALVGTTREGGRRMDNVGLLVLGAVLAVVGGSRFLKERRLHRRGSRTTGRVVDYQHQQGSSFGGSAAFASDSGMPQNSTQDHYYPVLELTTADGQMVRTVSREGSIVQGVTGEQVRILYDPADPKLAEIDESMVRTAWWPTLLGLLGLLVMLAGILGLIAAIVRK